MAVLLLALALSFSGLTIEAAADDEYKGKESWGYIDVRKDAHMFWWLYYTDVAENYKDYPLVIWLQGGPGAASTGFGNFEEIGPYDTSLKYRNTTWVKKANILFLDNPVGTGYSYVSNNASLCNNSVQITNDLVELLSKFLEHIPEFQKSPLYIYSESYGGKMAADWSVALYRSIKAGKIVCNFKGVVMADSWISPFDYVDSWGKYLYAFSMIDKRQLNELEQTVKEIGKAITSGSYKEASDLQSVLQEKVLSFTNHVSFYNILKTEAEEKDEEAKAFPYPKTRNSYNLNVGYYHGDDLAFLMNGKIRDKLHIIPKNVTWAKESEAVFNTLAQEFMKPAIDSVETLLNETTLSVTIVAGQLDLICDVLGTEQWMEKLRWPGMNSFFSAERKTILLNPNVTAGFVKSFKQLSFFNILNAGHMIPQDAGLSGLKMLDMILNEK